MYRRHLVTYLKEGILLIDPNLYRWRFLFLKGYLSAQKKSKPARITSTNILNHVINSESRGVLIAKRSLRVFARMAR